MAARVLQAAGLQAAQSETGAVPVAATAARRVLRSDLLAVAQAAAQRS